MGAETIMRYLFIAGIIVIYSPPSAASVTPDAATYKQLSKAIEIRKSGDISALCSPIDGSGPIFVAFDGTFSPGAQAKPELGVTIDGNLISSSSAIDWAGSTAPVEHSFRAIGAAMLKTGKHIVCATAKTNAPFILRASAGLAVMLRPATSVRVSKLVRDSNSVKLDNASIRELLDPLPSNPMLNIRLDRNKDPTIILAAGSARYSGGVLPAYGDAMWDLLLNNEEIDADRQTFADNDIWFKSELTAPMAVQGFLPHTTEGDNVSLNATVEPWGSGRNNPVRYIVNKNTTLIALQGGMRVMGSASSIDRSRLNPKFRRFSYTCIGSSRRSTGCPSMGSSVSIAQGELHVPQGHSGVVYFSGITRLQGADNDGGGSFTLKLKIDGEFKGSIGSQTLNSISTVSTRTVTVGYLTAGPAALRPGIHRVELIAQANGEFLHLAIPRGLSLIWFD